MPKIDPAVRRMAPTVMRLRYGLAVFCVVAALLVTELLQYLTDGPMWFVFLALLISWLSDRHKRAEAALRQARDELEARVQARTAELTRTNEQLQAEIAERTRVEREREQLLAREQAAHAEVVAAQHRFRDLVNSIEGIVWEADAQTLQFLFIS